MWLVRPGLILTALSLALAAGCDDGIDQPGADLSTAAIADLTGVAPGGFVSGPIDAHCKTDGGSQISQPTSQSVCFFKPDGGGDAGGDYGETLYNGVSDDDDCKYHVEATTAGLYQNVDAYFSVRTTATGDGSAVTGAKASAEVFLSDLHAGDTNDMVTVESPAGTYKIGPVRFDQSGKWTVRFHFFQECYDYSEESPHGHAAYYVNVP